MQMTNVVLEPGEGVAAFLTHSIFCIRSMA